MSKKRPLISSKSMFHKVYQPHPALKEFVNNITVQRVIPDPTQPKPVFPLPPLQEQNLCFYPYDSVAIEYLPEHKRIIPAHSIIVARMTNRVNLVMGYNHLIVRVGFHPGGLYRLLGIPIKELEANEGYDSTYLLDKELCYITEQLNECAGYDNMASIVERYLLSKLNSLKEVLLIDKMLSKIIERGGLINIDEVASQACVSVRHLERLFQQRIGLPPKFFARLVRFTKAWIYKEDHPKENWISIAYHCGYFDQMHLIHDFKEFAGVSLPLSLKKI
jgi:AraC-like DNA-binding protein